MVKTTEADRAADDRGSRIESNSPTKYTTEPNPKWVQYGDWLDNHPVCKCLGFAGYCSGQALLGFCASLPPGGIGAPTAKSK
jgi:hypothetical protein